MRLHQTGRLPDNGLRPVSFKEHGMKLVSYQENGHPRWAWVKDSDGPEMARFGIPANPPDLSLIDWEGMKGEITDAFNSLGLLTWQDVERSPVGLQSAMSIFKRHLIDLFRQDERMHQQR